MLKALQPPHLVRPLAPLAKNCARLPCQEVSKRAKLWQRVSASQRAAAAVEQPL